MFNYRNLNLKLLSLTLLATVGFQNINEASAKLIKTINSNDLKSYIRASETEVGSQTRIQLDNSVAGLSNVESKLWENSRKDGQLVELSDDHSPLLLVSSDPQEDSFSDLKNTSKLNFNNESKSPRVRFIKVVSLSIFLLLFSTFGIFYPFFILYKKLLNVDTNNYEDLTNKSIKSSETAESNSKIPIRSLSSETIKSEKSDSIQATVSKLQIAFAVENEDIRHKLAELCSSVDPRTDRGIAELMRKTISLIISQDEWTHISCSSESLPINRIKGEFELISSTEKSKFVSEELSLVGGEERPLKSNQSPSTDSPNYVVVTLILCTSHTESLFQEIRTKKQLVQELSELGKMRQDDIIKFDLLWNPQAEDRYLSNNELLKKYIDMMRLF